MGDGTLVASEYLVFTWADGLLQKVEENSWAKESEEEAINKRVIRTYTWEAGNVVKTNRQTIKDGNITEETEYNIEYSNVANPFHGFIFLIHPNSGIIFDYEGIDALSKNLPSRITSSKHRYEFSFSGEPVNSGEKLFIADTSPILRMSTDYSLDFEYLK